MAQTLTPSTDITTVTWTVTGAANHSLALSLIGDAEYSQSAPSPSGANVLEVRLTSGTDPLESSNHIVYYRYQKSLAGSENINLTVSLIQNTTVIRSEAISSIPNGFTNGNFTLTAGEANNITDYGNLRIRFAAAAAGGAPPNTAQIAYAYMEIPDAPKSNINADGLLSTTGNASWSGNGQVGGFAGVLATATLGTLGNIPLFINGVLSHSGNLNLYMHGRQLLGSGNSNIPMSIFSYNGSGLFGATNLFLQSDASGTFNNLSYGGPVFPLYIAGPNSANTSGNMMLYVHGNLVFTGTQSIPLVVWNNNIVVPSSIPLFIEGEGVTENYIPINNSGLFLWIQRPTSNTIPLYLQAPLDTGSGNIPMVIFGAITNSSGVPLVIPNVTEIIRTNIPLHTTGF